MRCCSTFCTQPVFLLMDITTLKTFLEVAKVKHFGRAADNLYVTQSAVSARVKAIRRIVGSRIISQGAQ